MTFQTTARAARNLERYLILRDQIEAARREAADDYIERGVAAYAERGALRGDLCLLVTLGDLAGERSAVSLAELRGLEGLVDETTARLTPAGAEAAAAAAIAHGMAHVLVRHNRAR